MWFQKNKGKLLAAAAVLIILTIAFFAGGDLPEKDTPVQPQNPALEGLNSPEEKAPLLGQAGDTSALQEPTLMDDPAEGQLSDTPQEPSEASEGPENSSAEEIPETGANAPSETEKMPEEPVDEMPAEAGTPEVPQTPPAQDPYHTDPIPEGKPAPVEPQDAVKTDEAHVCIISISCETILSNMDLLDPEKQELVPEDGWILKPEKVTFYEGESVFNVLLRTCKKKGIHMEFENTPIYNSAYIEGIHNLYEFDAGELSGWMYKVNGWFPNYGCSRYQLSDGDEICWVYTCDLGNDVGGGYSTGN